MFPISLFLYDKLSMPRCLREVLISHTLKKHIFQPSGHSHCCAKGSWQESHPVFLRGWPLKATVTGLARILKHSERQRPHHHRRHAATPCENKLLMSCEWQKATKETLQPLRGTAYKRASAWRQRGHSAPVIVLGWEWMTELGIRWWELSMISTTDLLDRGGKQSLPCPGSRLKVRPPSTKEEKKHQFWAFDTAIIKAPSFL